MDYAENEKRGEAGCTAVCSSVACSTADATAVCVSSAVLLCVFYVEEGGEEHGVDAAGVPVCWQCAVYYAEAEDGGKGEKERKKGERDGKHLFSHLFLLPTVVTGWGQ